MFAPSASAQDGDAKIRGGSPPAERPATKEEPSFVLVDGQITNHIGAGESGVVVTVHRKTDDDSVGELVGQAETDEYGDFSVKVAKPLKGDFVVLCSAPDYAVMRREIHVGDEEFPPFIAETLVGKLVVIGRVIGELDDAPIPGATVTLTSMYAEWNETTKDDGTFTITGVFPGRGQLVVEHEGYGRQRQEVLQVEDFGEIVVSLKPERLVHIEVVDDAGKPVAGAIVECLDQAREDFRTVMTDQQGKTTISGLHFDIVNLALRLTHDDHVSDEDLDRSVTTPEDKAESTHKLIMQRGAKISGSVVDAITGNTIYGARIMTGDQPSDNSPREWSNDRGKFTIRGVSPGKVVLTTHFAGFAPDMRTVDAVASETTEVEIKLGAGAVIKGIVKDDQGEPVPGVQVQATMWRECATLGLRATTGHDGTFTLWDAPHDEFEISAYTYRIEPVSRKVKAGESELFEIVLPVSPGDGEAGAAGWVRVGDTAPVLELKTLDGSTIRFADLKGKIVLLVFWATWCGPCVADLPHLLAVHKKFSKREDFVMVSVSLDGDEKILRDFVKRRGMKWHQVYGEVGGAETAAKRYGVTGIPALFLIGADGKIISAGLVGDAIEKRVEQVLKDIDPT